MVTDWYSMTADTTLIYLSISHSVLPPLMNKTQRYLKSSTWGGTTPTRGRSTLFQQRTTAFNLEVLILIPAASHSAACHSSESWRSWLNGGNRMTSPAHEHHLKQQNIQKGNKTEPTQEVRWWSGKKDRRIKRRLYIQRKVMTYTKQL